MALVQIVEQAIADCQAGIDSDALDPVAAAEVVEPGDVRAEGLQVKGA